LVLLLLLGLILYGRQRGADAAWRLEPSILA
jgi:hypothetical protein